MYQIKSYASETFQIYSSTFTIRLVTSCDICKKVAYLIPWEAILSKAPPREYIMKNMTNEGNTQEIQVNMQEIQVNTQEV